MLGFRMLPPHSSLFPPRFWPARSLRDHVAPNFAHKASIRETSLFFHSTCHALLSEISRPMRSYARETRTTLLSLLSSRTLAENRKNQPLSFQWVAHSLKICISATPAISAVCALFAKKSGVGGYVRHDSALVNRDSILIFADSCCQTVQNVTRSPSPEMPLPRAAAPNFPALRRGRPPLLSLSAFLPTIRFARRSSDAPTLCRLSSRAVHPRPCTLPPRQLLAASSAQSVRHENIRAVFRSVPLHTAAALSRQDFLPSPPRSPEIPRCCFAAVQILPALAIAREPRETTSPSREIRRRATARRGLPLAPRAPGGVVASAAAKSSRPALAQADRPLAAVQEPSAAGLVSTESAALLLREELAPPALGNLRFSAVAAAAVPPAAAGERKGAPVPVPLARATPRPSRVSVLRAAAEPAPAGGGHFVQPDAPAARTAPRTVRQVPPRDSGVPLPRVFHRK